MQSTDNNQRAAGTLLPAYLNGRRREVLIAALAGGSVKG